MVAFSCLHRGTGVGPQATHIPAHANLKSCLWSLQLPKSLATQVKLAFRADESFLLPWTKKRSEMEARHWSLPSPTAPECTQHPFPAPSASSCSCFFLPRNPHSEPKQLAKNDVFPNSIRTGGACSLWGATVRHTSAMSHHGAGAEYIVTK